MTIEKPSDTSLAPLAFFIPGLNGGGAQRVFVTLVNTLVTMTDHPIHLVTSRQGGSFESLVDERVVRVVLGHERVSRSVLSLARYLRRERPLAMISTLNYCNVVFLLAAMLARLPMRKVIREANVIHDEFDPAVVKYKTLALRCLMRLLYRRADDLIIITKDVGDSLRQRRIAPVAIMRPIPNPVMVEEAPGSATENIESLRDGFILSIGRLSYQKGFDILIQAFAQLEDQNLQLVILGAGAAEGLKALAQEKGVAERVFFPGFVADTSAYLKAASLFVLPSRWEGFSNVLAEALALGAPIVASDCPGSPREVLDGGRLGRLVPVGDAAALAAAINGELKSPSAPREARKDFAKQYAPEKIAHQYLQILMGNWSPGLASSPVGCQPGVASSER